MKINTLVPTAVILFAAVLLTAGNAHASYPLDQWSTALFSQFTVTNGAGGTTEDADHVFLAPSQSPFLLYTYIGSDSPASFLITYTDPSLTPFTYDPITINPGQHTVALNSEIANHAFWVNTLDFQSAGHAEYIVTDKPGNVVPEPAAMALFAMGGIPMGISFLRRRKTLLA